MPLPHNRIVVGLLADLLPSCVHPVTAACRCVAAVRRRQSESVHSQRRHGLSSVPAVLCGTATAVMKQGSRLWLKHQLATGRSTTGTGFIVAPCDTYDYNIHVGCCAYYATGQAFAMRLMKQYQWSKAVATQSRCRCPRTQRVCVDTVGRMT